MKQIPRGVCQIHHITAFFSFLVWRWYVGGVKSSVSKNLNFKKPGGSLFSSWDFPTIQLTRLMSKLYHASYLPSLRVYSFLKFRA